MSSPILLPYRGTFPRVHPTAWLAPGAAVLGDVEIGEDSSVWFGAVVRGDVFPIRIGARTNIQDGTVIHVTTDQYATVVGDECTVGHRVVLHGCTVHDRCLVGINAVVLDRAVIGPDAWVGAGALVTPGTVIPPGTLALGAPARVKRDLRPDEVEWLRWAAAHYVDIARNYASPGPQPG